METVKVESTTEAGSSSALRFALVETQGGRPTQEDAYAFSFDESGAADFWVLDGHRGAEAARFGSKALSKEIGQSIKKRKLPSNENIQQGFKSVDNQLRKHFKKHPEGAKSGSTVVGALVAKQKDGTYTAKLINCGDSRGLIVKGPVLEEKEDQSEGCNETPSDIVVETKDHKPGDYGEKCRILAAGGKLKGSKSGGCCRIDGRLAVSRGLGDFEFKAHKNLPAAEQKVSCIPDVYEVAGLVPGTLLILACDGIWGVMSSQEVATKIREELNGDCQKDLKAVAASVVNESLERGSQDNLTLLLVHLGNDEK